jgi:hypothetical protein
METDAHTDTPARSGTSNSTDGVLKPAVEQTAAMAPADTPTGIPKRAILRLPIRLAGNSRKNRGAVMETAGNFNEDYAE